MKKIISSLLIGTSLLVSTSCSDSSYDDKYADPSKTTEVNVPQVFTGVLFKAKAWTDLMYYRYYTQSATEGLFSGVIGDNNSSGRFRGQGEGYNNTHWQNFYDMVTQYRLLEATYEELPEDERSINEVFFHLARVVVYAQLHEMLSLFGDVPFNGAGTLWQSSDYDAAKTLCVYDDDVELYRQILNDLKETGDYLNGGVNSQSTTSLANQDYTVAAGDTEIWRKYTNSLRLRIALHLATNGECTSEAHAAIAEILNNPGQYPLIESNAENMGVNADTQTDDFNYGKSLSQALHTGNMAAGSQTMLRVMNVPENGIPDKNTDPRIQVMYDPNPDGEYVAFDIKLTNSEISNLEEQKRQEYINRGITTANYYCEIDSQAVAGWEEYQGNENIMSLWLNAAEVSLSKAEAYLMGYGVATDQNKARECFIEGVKLSTEFYWNMKKTSTLYKEGNDSYRGYRTLQEPTGDEIQAYAESIWEPTQERICEQLWLNFSFMNELEAWNVTRRTGYPVVYFSRDIQVSSYPTPPHRLPYVSDELNYNSDNVQQAITTNCGGDNTLGGYYTPLFWAKENYYQMIN
ncbi:SusD/RagB family nutrient-binding outer membrane lipoprotein [uncultured Parabacteroides sp.]|uniref:SusD/RagB family nutrient-binding outer membrane lipoprotein n=1 Tax=uncultured Parabacteroides sp. TaxID=512312 RepID=UPI0026111A32|nr:SusD/RagB family nutrient-binding outer membrane lipoprotein [uncultured Parabacteroides sp.]